MKKTAVEWLEELYNSCPRYEATLTESDFKQAKEMEKQQIIDAYNECIWERKQNEGEQYYNQTFKQD